jgi:cell division septal protein FtsQ
VRKKQKVVLRSKVRQQRAGFLRAVFAGGFKFCLAVAVLAGASIFARRFLAHSDIFLIKSVRLVPAESPVASEILKVVEPLKGRNIFKIAPVPMEKSLSARLSSVKELRISRRFPASVKVSYEVRVPLARVPGGSEPCGVDEEGVKFPLSLGYSKGAEKLPEVVSASSATLKSALPFLKAWTLHAKEFETEVSSFSLARVFVDDQGEISFATTGELEDADGTRVIWGFYGERTFPGKLRTFGKVWRDLESKKQKAKYINLREVPESRALALEDGEIVGRVFVRTEKDQQEKIPWQNKKS